jgi:hypothetical protein
VRRTDAHTILGAKGARLSAGLARRPEEEKEPQGLKARHWRYERMSSTPAGSSNRPEAKLFVEALKGRVPYHIGVSTRDIADAQRQLSAVFDITWAPVKETKGDLPMIGAYVGPTRISHSRGEGLRFELLEGTAGSVYETDAVATLHHYAYWSEDVAGDVDALEADGWVIEIAAVDEHGTPSLMAYLTKPDFPRIEVASTRLRPGYEVEVGISKDAKGMS